MNRFSLSLFLLFFSISLAFAVTTYNQDYDICLNKYSSEPIIQITNANLDTIFYEVKYIKTNKIIMKTIPHFVKTNTQNIFLKNNQSAQINYELYFPFTGTEKFTIQISENGIIKKIYNYNYNVRNCHNITAELIFKDSYCQNYEQNYTLKITNDKIYDENLTIKIDNNTFNLSLNKGEKKEFNLPLYRKKENNQINLSIKNDFLDYYNEYEINITDCDNSIFFLNPITPFCENQKVTKSLIIKNNGVNNETYNLTGEYEDFNINIHNFSLKPGKTKTLYYDIFSRNDSKTFIKNITFELSNNKQLVIPFNYSVKDCYSQNITIEPQKDIICEKDNGTLFFNVKNTGVKDNEFSIFTEFMNNTINETMFLNSNQSKNYSINYINISQGEYVLSILFFNEDSEKTILNKTLTVQSFDKCYSGELILEPTFLTDPFVIIKNNGLRKNNYTLSIISDLLKTNTTFSLNASEEKILLLNQLTQLKKEYNISFFELNLGANNVNLTKSTEYSEGFFADILKEFNTNTSLLLAITALIVFIFLIIKKK